MLSELFGSAPEDLVCKMQVYNAVGLPVLELDTAHKNIFRRKFALVLLKDRFCRGGIDFDALEHVASDWRDQSVPSCGEFEPMAGHWLLRHECPAALLRAQEAFLAQDVNRLANGDARDRKLTFKFDQRRNLLTGKPLLRLDPAAHDRGDLDVQRNA